MRFCDGADSISMVSSQQNNQARNNDLHQESLNGGHSIDRPTESRDVDSSYLETSALLGSNLTKKHQYNLRTDLNQTQEPTRNPKLSLDVQAVLNLQKKKKQELQKRDS